MPLFTPVATGGYLDVTLHLKLQVDTWMSLYTCSYRWILGCHSTPVATGGYLDVTLHL